MEDAGGKKECSGFGEGEETTRVPEHPPAIYLVTGINESYLARAGAYLASMNRNSNVHNVVITLDFEIPASYREAYPAIRFVTLSSSQVKSPNANTCMQHGGFLRALDFLGEGDIIIYTDADIEVQRAFGAEELRMLRDSDDGEIGASLNRCRENRLVDEAGQLDCRVGLEDLTAKYPGIGAMPTFNTGVLVANRRTYEQLFAAYNEHWRDFQGLFGHYAKQQWLLSYLIHTRFRPKILPQEIHSHGHDPTPQPADDRAGFRFCVGSQPVVLNHAIRHPAEERVHRLEKHIRRLDRRNRRLLIALAVTGLLCLLLLMSRYTL